MSCSSSDPDRFARATRAALDSRPLLEPERLFADFEDLRKKLDENRARIVRLHSDAFSPASPCERHERLHADDALANLRDGRLGEQLTGVKPRNHKPSSERSVLEAMIRELGGGHRTCPAEVVPAVPRRSGIEDDSEAAVDALRALVAAIETPKGEEMREEKVRRDERLEAEAALARRLADGLEEHLRAADAVRESADRTKEKRRGDGESARGGCDLAPALASLLRSVERATLIK